MAPEAPSDCDLLCRFREDEDRTALAVLFERHRGLAYRVALGVVGTPADAEDAAQDAFLRLLRFAPRARADGSLAGLVAHMALRAAQDLARASGRRRAREQAAAGTAPPVSQSAFEELAEREARRAVRDAVSALDDRYRLPILLHYFEGLSVRETAEALGISQTAVTTRLSRAVGKLRQQMGRGSAALTAPALLGLLASEGADAAPASLSASLQALAATTPAAAPASAGAAALAGSALFAKAAAAAVAVLVAAGGIGAWQGHRTLARAAGRRLPTAHSPASTPQPRAVLPAVAQGLPAGHVPRKPDVTGAAPAERVPGTALRNTGPAPGTPTGVGRAPAPTATPDRRSVPTFQVAADKRAGAAASGRPARPKGSAPPPARRQAPGKALDSGPPARAQPRQERVASVIAQAIAVNRARELAIETIRGFVVYDQRRSEAEMARRRKLLEEMARGHGIADPTESPRTICAAEVVVAEDRLRLDGVMLNDGTWNDLGISPRPAFPVRPPGPAPGQTSGSGAPLPRTLIVYDGERHVTYNESAGECMGEPQQMRISAMHLVSQDPFGSGWSGGFADTLGRWPTESVPGQMIRQRRYLGEETVDGVRCVKLRYTYRFESVPPDRPFIPSGSRTCWLARPYGFAPVRDEAMIRLARKDGPPMFDGRLWVAGGYRELQPDLWLPTRVLLQRNAGDEGRVSWRTIHVKEYFGLAVNQAPLPDDFVHPLASFAPPTTGIMRVPAREAALPPLRVEQREDAWARATEWARKPPPVQPDAAFEARMREYARQGPPASPAPKPQGGAQ